MGVPSNEETLRDDFCDLALLIIVFRFVSIIRSIRIGKSAIPKMRRVQNDPTLDGRSAAETNVAISAQGGSSGGYVKSRRQKNSLSTFLNTKKRKICFGSLVVLVLVLLVDASLVVDGGDPCVVAAEARTRIQRSKLPIRLPKIIHQQWKTASVPKEFQRYRNDFQTLFPP